MRWLPTSRSDTLTFGSLMYLESSFEQRARLVESQAPDIQSRQQVEVNPAVRANSGGDAGSGIAQDFELNGIARAESEEGIPGPQQVRV